VHHLTARVVLGPAKELFGGLVHIRHAALGVGGVEALAHAVGDRSQIVGGLLQPLCLTDDLVLGLAPGGHVLVADDQASGAGAGEARRPHDEEPLGSRPVTRILHRELRLGTDQQSAQPGPCPVSELIARCPVACLEVVVTQRRGQNATIGDRELHPRSVGHHDRSGLVKDGDVRRQRIQRRLQKVT
jgi:hypothetical protein